MNKNTICLWYNGDAEAAGAFLRGDLSRQRRKRRASRAVRLHFRQKGRCAHRRVHGLRHPLSWPQWRGLCSSTTKHSPFRSPTDTQEETDRYWNAIVGNGGEESACGWCKTSGVFRGRSRRRALTGALAAGGAEGKRAFEAMMKMRKIDIGAIEAARRG